MLMAEAKSAKKRLLILGSGFSKAVSEKMPVVRELADALKQQIEADPELKDLEDPKYQNLLKDPELLLTYLAQDQPWKEPWETAKETGIYLRITQWLGRYIEAAETKAMMEGFQKQWPKQLVEWLHQAKIGVISFNYDTLLERICWEYVRAKSKILGYSGVEEIPEEIPLDAFNLYKLPLAPLSHREAGTGHPPIQNSFHLVKLHGSINWFYSGSSDFAGEQIYYKPVDSRFPFTDMTSLNVELLTEEVTRLSLDKYRLIIPPVAEKSRFYSNQTIRSLWSKARKYLEEAEEIYCIGYSLPDTDLTTKLLFQTACAGQAKTVYIVNNDMDGKDNLLRRYRDAFPQGTIIKCDYIREDAVEAMVDNLCKEEEAYVDRIHSRSNGTRPL
jgi:hypothetical protein